MALPYLIKFPIHFFYFFQFIEIYIGKNTIFTKTLYINVYMV